MTYRSFHATATWTFSARACADTIRRVPAGSPRRIELAAIDAHRREGLLVDTRPGMGMSAATKLKPKPHGCGRSRHIVA
jgi:hypothetical protein